MNIKSTLVGVIASVILSLGLVSLTHTGSKTVVQQVPTENTKAVASSEIYAPYLCLNGGNSPVTGAVCRYVSSGAFADGTTTLALIQNPFGATSTVTIALLTGTNGTTTVNILAGTTTLTKGQSVINDNQISATLANTTSVATSTNFFIVSGVRYGTGANDAGAGSAARIIVGPSESIAILATSTTATYATGLQGVTGASNTFTGTYKLEWLR